MRESKFRSNDEGSSDEGSKVGRAAPNYQVEEGVQGECWGRE